VKQYFFGTYQKKAYICPQIKKTSMKKTFRLLLLTLLVSVAQTHAQDCTDYVQFGTDFGLIYPGLLIRGEYGKTWKWLEVGLSMTYETDRASNTTRSATLPIRAGGHTSNLPIDYVDITNSASLSLHAGVDLIWFFSTQSRHALKVGAGLGHEFYARMTQSNDGRNYSVSMENKLNILPSFQASYAYAITPRLAVGAFCLYGRFFPSLGLSIRRNM
jgi:hypothetical protein